MQNAKYIVLTSLGLVIFMWSSVRALQYLSSFQSFVCLFFGFIFFRFFPPLFLIYTWVFWTHPCSVIPLWGSCTFQPTYFPYFLCMSSIIDHFWEPLASLLGLFPIGLDRTLQLFQMKVVEVKYTGVLMHSFSQKGKTHLLVSFIKSLLTQWFFSYLSETQSWCVSTFDLRNVQRNQKTQAIVWAQKKPYRYYKACTEEHMKIIKLSEVKTTCAYCTWLTTRNTYMVNNNQTSLSIICNTMVIRQGTFSYHFLIKINLSTLSEVSGFVRQET